MAPGDSETAQKERWAAIVAGAIRAHVAGGMIEQAAEDLVRRKEWAVQSQAMHKHYQEGVSREQVDVWYERALREALRPPTEAELLADIEARLRRLEGAP